MPVRDLLDGAAEPTTQAVDPRLETVATAPFDPTSIQTLMPETIGTQLIFRIAWPPAIVIIASLPVLNARNAAAKHIAPFAAAMLFGSVEKAAQESKRMAAEHGLPDQKVMCSYFVDVAHSDAEAERVGAQRFEPLDDVTEVRAVDLHCASSCWTGRS